MTTIEDAKKRIGKGEAYFVALDLIDALAASERVRRQLAEALRIHRTGPHGEEQRAAAEIAALAASDALDQDTCYCGAPKPGKPCGWVGCDRKQP